ncbi:unnamed protein product [Polarella glacialis]|uniref:Uncharacterized protein n=1 Tax=Polarella glacialis TaxID=89957 RepID=A0A813IYZ7_POLGL|nr:unnamed protein product [Polarella glacialis]CAE8661845.1 unnamed protein product [Polarella glacialis]
MLDRVPSAAPLVHGQQGVHTRALGIIGGHVTGFAAIHTSAHMQAEEPFKNSPWLQLVVMVIFASVWACLAFVSRKIREVITQIDKELTEEEEEAEDDVAAICLGKLFCNSMRYFILGHDPSKEILLCKTCAAPSYSQAATMYSVGVGFMVLMFLANHYHVAIKRIEYSQVTKRFVKLVLATFAFSASWTILFANYWFFKTVDSGSQIQAPVLQMLVVALFVGLCSMLVIFVMDYLADNEVLEPKGLRHLMTAVGLMVGLSWEACFDMATEALGEGLSEEASFSHAGTYWMALLNLSLVAISYPAWRLYIMPKAYPDLQQLVGKHPPISSLWGFRQLLNIHNNSNSHDETHEESRELTHDHHHNSDQEGEETRENGRKALLQEPL